MVEEEGRNRKEVNKGENKQMWEERENKIILINIV
jgi:hypothetical protein